MPTTAADLKQRIADGHTICNVGYWLPCARRWVSRAAKAGQIVTVRSGFPDNRPAYRAP